MSPSKSRLKLCYLEYGERFIQVRTKEKFCKLEAGGGKMRFFVRNIKTGKVHSRSSQTYVKRLVRVVND